MGHLEQLAPGLNAYTFTFDDGSPLDELRDAYSTVVAPDFNEAWLRGGESRSGEITRDGLNYHMISYGTSSLVWVSCNDAKTYGAFRRFFDALDIASEVKPLVDHDRDIIVYCGFFVLGNYADEETWHLDYESGSNAFTFLTPLFPLDEAHGGLLYYDQESEVTKYTYRGGEALLFGDDFYHTTEKYGRTDTTRVLVSMTLGTDKLKYWPKLEKVVGHQSEFLILPCGDQRGTCDHLPE